MNNIPPFHLAIPVHDVELNRKFYLDVLGCTQGRSSDTWVDLDLYGHQLVIHYKPKAETQEAHHNPVDGKSVPVPHFGVVLPWEEFHSLADRVKSKGITFVIEPYIRFEGQPGEQATMFFEDPSGNAIEFKSFKDPEQLFAT
ncbi:glyoxalase [Robertkochia marina]|uniref:Glyoxalase n=1 Tax=Robertkochia marina TaxID=1227945 RepID=A0A4S3M6V9_9FLAO|nr:VOC family protein [Robertkochia marina]THD69977.1 glyoxalase [Robertkochia marina]TRZ46678.1 glyoxalase [Robertkochia marina]